MSEEIDDATSNMIAIMKARLSKHNDTAGVAPAKSPVQIASVPATVSPDIPSSPFVNTPKIETDFLETLPVLSDDEFLLHIEWDDHKIIFCVKELDWRTAMDIESRAFRMGESDNPYLAGEYEKRETLRAAIIWAAEVSSKTLILNKNQDILRRIHQFVIEQLWVQYYPKVTLDAKEANILYTAARKYFTGNSQDGYPTIALIAEVDMLCKPLVSMTLAELRSIKISDFERMKLILMAREESLGLMSDAIKMQYSSSQALVSKGKNDVLPDWMYPESVRQGLVER